MESRKKTATSIKQLFNLNDSTSKSQRAQKLWNDYVAEMKNQENYLQQSIEIQPIPSFVCKSILNNINGTKTTKVFINVCSHQLIGRSCEARDPNTGQMGWR